MTIILQKTTDTAFLKDIETGLEAHSAKTIGKNKTPVYFVVQDASGVKGGMKASYVGASFFVSWLQVDESLRGQGWGKKLKAAAGEEARKRGCCKMFVDTLSFQAPKFYEALGFRQCALIPGYYDGYDRIFFQKDL
jgi:ribosomal protein S18 acetylase RimI-like enzyme